MQHAIRKFAALVEVRSLASPDGIAKGVIAKDWLEDFYGNSPLIAAPPDMEMGAAYAGLDTTPRQW